MKSRLKKIKNKIAGAAKKALAKIDGKKTIIGLGLHTIWFAANIAFKDLSSTTEAAIGHTIIGSWTGYGLGDKIYKNKDKINEAIASGVEKINKLKSK